MASEPMTFQISENISINSTATEMCAESEANVKIGGKALTYKLKCGTIKTIERDILQHFNNALKTPKTS